MKARIPSKAMLTAKQRTLPKALQAKIIKARGAYDLIFDEKDFQTKLISLEQFNPAHFNYTDSMGKADELMRDNGFLSSADMLQMHPEALKDIMEDAVDLKIPNKVDYESGPNWGSIK